MFTPSIKSSSGTNVISTEVSPSVLVAVKPSTVRLSALISSSMLTVALHMVTAPLIVVSSLDQSTVMV